MEQAAAPPSNLNIANALTVLRIAGVPVFGWLLLSDGGQSIEMRLWAFLAFTLLMITDRIDGDLARSRNLVTNFGKLADPIADKALTGMAFIGLAIIFHSWWFTTAVVLIMIREWGITVLRLVVKKYGVMPASQGGKLKTTLQAVAIGGYILPFELWDNPVCDLLRILTHIVFAACFALTMVTGVQYVRDALKLRTEQHAGAS